ncbi:hypothetical protein [uncultured Chryseobacterium sp.]|uniref:hypothetical protein n=1 Tax=uncultured Chryseobacterium sp. TaxID=259322 RepID=UPI0025F78AFF|nr:hypothetical protein [uncultured Chryseobacterium sp.]
MKNYSREFNYIMYYSDSTNEQDDLHFYAEDFGPDKMQGIFKLTLGLHFPEILFLERIENVSTSWPPYIDYRMIESAEDIRKALLLEKSYIVLPCNEWAGQVKILEPENKNPISSDPETYYGYKSVIFFITEQEYETYKQEAKKIEELNDLEVKRGYDVISQTHTEDLEKYMKLPIFIKEKIIPYFNDNDLYNIGRKRDQEGNVVFTKTIGNK